MAQKNSGINISVQSYLYNRQTGLIQPTSVVNFVLGSFSGLMISHTSQCTKCTRLHSKQAGVFLRIELRIFHVDSCYQQVTLDSSPGGRKVLNFRLHLKVYTGTCARVSSLSLSLSLSPPHPPPPPLSLSLSLSAENGCTCNQCTLPKSPSVGSLATNKFAIAVCSA